MNDKKLTVGFIGCGNMGGALARAIKKSSVTEMILLSDSDNTKAQALATELDCRISDNETIAKAADFIFLGVKPNMITEVVEKIASALSENPDAIIVSMAAGVSCDKVKKGISNTVIRIMPNTPVLVGSGMIVYCGKVDTGTDEIFKKLMEHAGRLDIIDESKIDAASAVSGCGPAFAYMFIDALADGAVSCGLSREKALLYAAATLEGAAKMVLETKEHPDVLKDRVCSPGGSTIEGVRALEEGAFRATAINAVLASYEKTKKLGQ